MFLTETHCHTARISPCSNISAARLVSDYRQAGYSTIVVTDHYRRDTVNGGMEGRSPAARVARYLSGFREAEAAGAAAGLHVLFGIELAYAGRPEDFLLYGVTVPFLEAHTELFNLTQEEVFRLAGENGILLYQAHPFRRNLRQAPPELLHGAEVYNGHNHHDSHNDAALAFAEKNSLLQISGSDCHDIDCVGRGGIATEREIATTQDLLAALRDRRTRLIRDGAVCGEG